MTATANVDPSLRKTSRSQTSPCRHFAGRSGFVLGENSRCVLGAAVLAQRARHRGRQVFSRPGCCVHGCPHRRPPLHSPGYRSTLPCRAAVHASEVARRAGTQRRAAGIVACGKDFYRRWIRRAMTGSTASSSSSSSRGSRRTTCSSSSSASESITHACDRRPCMATMPRRTGRQPSSACWRCWSGPRWGRRTQAAGRHKQQSATASPQPLAAQCK